MIENIWVCCHEGFFLILFFFIEFWVESVTFYFPLFKNRLLLSSFLKYECTMEGANQFVTNFGGQCTELSTKVLSSEATRYLNLSCMIQIVSHPFETIVSTRTREIFVFVPSSIEAFEGDINLNPLLWWIQNLYI